MVSKRVTWIGVVALGFGLALVPVVASAQQATSGIAGVVRDTSGGVLPGVTVEAASPALIEKVRTVVTDGGGRYNVVDLRPGTYVVTFTLAGFNTFRRDGITLTAGFTATVNAVMQVGALEETITVSGAAPLIDAQNIRQQTRVSDELLLALPSGSRGLMGFGKFVPGMVPGQDSGSGGATGIQGSNATATATLHGKGGAKVSFDGMHANNLTLSGGSLSYIVNPELVQETVVETGGISAESTASGLMINLVPKEGANDFRFGINGTYTNKNLQGDNLSDNLRARGLATAGKVLHFYDANVTEGGPVLRNRLWFFAAQRLMGTQNQVPGQYFNAAQGTVGPFIPDLNRPQYFQDWLRTEGGRVTWQVSPKNKVNVFADVEYYMTRGQGDNSAPEAQSCYYMWPDGLYQATWTSPVTNKLLLEAGAQWMDGDWPCTREHLTDSYDFIVKPTDVSIRESSTGFVYNAASSYLNRRDQDRYVERFATSYITGSHTFKAGFQLQQHVENDETVVNSDVTYTFTRGVPTGITQYATPYLQRFRTKAELGLFAQDRWTVKRLTLSYGLRFEYFNGYVPAQHVDAGQFVGARDFAPVYRVPEWTDLNPRLGASYDLFGTGRTALKVSLGRYVGRETVATATALNPINTSVNSVARTWNDANGNYIPDCNLANFGQNLECGAISNQYFGQNNPAAVQYADDVIRGFGKRDYFWDFAAEVQHELRQGVSLSGGYYRNWSDHFGSITGGGGASAGVTDNLAVTPADFEPYCITAPKDPKLPGGGGYPVCGLYDIVPAKFGQGTSRVARPSNYGNQSRISNFFNVSINTRFGGEATLGGSLDSGRTATDTCFVVDSPQQLLNCRVVTPFKGQTAIKVHGSYPLPGGFSASGVFQNLSGAQRLANYSVSNAAIVPSLLRNLGQCRNQAVCTASVTVPLIAPGTWFEPRRTVLDLRLSRSFSLGPRRRLRANFDIFNVLNADSLLSVNGNYGASWLRPSGRGSLVASRMIQLSGQLTF